MSLPLQIPSQKKEKLEELTSKWSALIRQHNQRMLCRIALFKHYWWLTTTCCSCGWSPNLRETTKAKLRRSKEKKGGMEAELQDWRQTFTGGVPEQLPFQLFFANPVFLNRLLVFFLKPTEVLNLPCSSCSCLFMVVFSLLSCGLAPPKGTFLLAGNLLL